MCTPFTGVLHVDFLWKKISFVVKEKKIRKDIKFLVNLTVEHNWMNSLH